MITLTADQLESLASIVDLIKYEGDDDTDTYVQAIVMVVTRGAVVVP